MAIRNTLKRYSEDYEVTEIADGVYKINEFDLSTMFLVVGSERALVIDSGTGINDFKSVIERLTDKEYDFVATHAHVDHIGGRGQFREMYISEKDAKAVKSVTVAYRRFYIGVMKYLMGFPCVKWKNVHIEKTVEPKIIPIKNGTRFDLGDRSVTVYEAEGHTLGSVTLVLDNPKIVFSGDDANPFCLMFLPNSSTLDVLNESLKKIKELSENAVIWASHLTEPLKDSDLNNAIELTERLKKKRNTLIPFVAFGKYKDYTMVYRTSHMHGRKR